jgi:OmpA-OmpF porin, OOP family
MSSPCPGGEEGPVAGAHEACRAEIRRFETGYPMTSAMTRFAGAAAAALLLASPGLAAAAELEGNIISHEGDKLVVRTSAGDTTVNLTPSTRIQSSSGLLGANKEDHPPSDLIRGLAVDIDTVQNGAEIDADKVSFKAGDLKTARAIQAGIEQPRQRLTAAQAENERRFSQVGQFAEKGRLRILFPSGSATISGKGMQDLHAFAQQAQATPGYLIRVAGFTDSTGSAATNQRLSSQRASAVTAYLVRNCNIPHEKILSPAAMGSYVPAEDEAPGGGSAQNRRVTVFILVSKAAQGPSSLPPSTSTSPSAPQPAPSPD